MLRSLAISNYALIDTLEITFPEGLIIITGETGAGKSILLGAMSLLLGSRAEKEILKDVSKNCVVEATFTIEPDSSTIELFNEFSIEPSNEEAHFSLGVIIERQENFKEAIMLYVYMYDLFQSSIIQVANGEKSLSSALKEI